MMNSQFLSPFCQGPYHEFLSFFQAGRGMIRKHLQCHSLLCHQLTGTLIHLAVVYTQPTEDGECLQPESKVHNCVVNRILLQCCLVVVEKSNKSQQSVVGLIMKKHCILQLTGPIKTYKLGERMLLNDINTTF